MRDCTHGIVFQPKTLQERILFFADLRIATTPSWQFAGPTARCSARGAARNVSITWREQAVWKGDGNPATSAPLMSGLSSRAAALAPEMAPGGLAAHGETRGQRGSMRFFRCHQVAAHASRARTPAGPPRSQPGPRILRFSPFRKPKAITSDSKFLGRCSRTHHRIIRRLR